MVSDHEECWSCTEEFGTREEAIAWGTEEFRAEGCARFWVGKKALYRARGVGLAVAEYMLERLSEHAFDFAGDFADDLTEGWPSYGMGQSLDKTEQELADRLQAVVDWYLTQDPPSFWSVTAIEEIEIPPGEPCP